MAQKRKNLKIIAELEQTQDQLIQSQEYVMEVTRRNKALEAERDEGSKKNQDLEDKIAVLRAKFEELKEKNGDLLEKLSHADLEKEKLRQRFKRKLKKISKRVRRTKNSDEGDDEELEVEFTEERESRLDERAESSNSRVLPTIKRASFRSRRRKVRPMTPEESEQRLVLPPIDDTTKMKVEKPKPRKKSRLPRWTRGKKVAPLTDC